MCQESIPSREKHRLLGVVDKSPPKTAVEPLVAMQQAPSLEQTTERVLAKKVSDASTPHKRLRGKTAVPAAGPPTPVNAPSGHNDRPSLKRQRESLHLDEEKELLDWMQRAAVVPKVAKKRKKTIQVSEKAICICYCCQAVFREQQRDHCFEEEAFSRLST